MRRPLLFALSAALMLATAASAGAQQTAPANPPASTAPAVAKPAEAAKPGADTRRPGPNAPGPDVDAAVPARAAPLAAARSGLGAMIWDIREAQRLRFRQNLRRSLAGVGLKEKAEQDAVLECVRSQDAAREDVRAAAAACAHALEDEDLPDAAVTKRLDEYSAASARALQQREKALAELDKKIRFSTRPRLKALLLLRGVIGTEAWLGSELQSERVDETDLRVLFPRGEE